MIEYLNTDLIDIDTNYVFVNFQGVNKHKPMRRANIEDLFSRIGKKAGIDNLSPHKLRHGAAVDMLSVLNAQTPEQSLNVMVQIKDKLRHKNISTTMSVYAEFSDSGKQAAMENYYNALNMNGYMLQLQEIEASIKIAEANGMDMLLQKNLKTKESLLNIINRLKNMEDENNE